MHSISVVPLANEQLRVLCIDPQISLQEKNSRSEKETVKKKKKRAHVKRKAACQCCRINGCTAYCLCVCVCVSTYKSTLCETMLEQSCSQTLMCGLLLLWLVDIVRYRSLTHLRYISSSQSLFQYSFNTAFRLTKPNS